MNLNRRRQLPSRALIGWVLLMGWGMWPGAVVQPAWAQATNEVEQLRRQLQELQDSFERSQEQQRQQIEALTRQLDQLQSQQAGAAKPPPPEPAAPAETNGPPPVASVPTPELTQRAWSPSDPIRLGNDRSYIGLSFDSLFAVGGMNKSDEVEFYEPGAHDPKQNGFTVQNLELVLDGKVDPYFSAQANIVFQIDPDGETSVEIEEAFLQTLSLPWNLQLKAGEYLTQFGRLNTQHPHSWDFVDVALVNARFLGPEGLRNPGMQLGWLAPTPFYSELTLSVQNSAGEAMYSFRDTHEDELFLGRFTTDVGSVNSLDDLLYTVHYSASFDLSDTQTVLLGGSGAFGPNSSGEDGRTQLYGIDLFYKWKAPNQSKGFPFVTWQTEWMYRCYDAAAYVLDEDNDGIPEIDLPAETLRDWGLYSQVAYGFRPRWVASLRGDYLAAGTGATIPTEDADRRWRISPALTFYPTEYSKIRLQYNYDQFETLGPAWGIWMQMEFLLGAHSAHKF
jgi:hypothetical protein